MTRQRSSRPSTPKPEWCKPSDADIEAAGGYYGEDGMWISFVRTKTDAARIARSHREFAVMSRVGTENIHHARAALTPEILSASGKKVGLWRRGRPGKGNTSGVAGVTWNKHRLSWIAHISVPPHSKKKSLGYFDTKEEAIAARKAAELKYWKD